MKVRTQIQAGASCYTVQKGDSLSEIAYMYYGDGSSSSWQKIWYSNYATIGSDPSNIQPGMKLYIP